MRVPFRSNLLAFRRFVSRQAALSPVRRTLVLSVAVAIVALTMAALALVCFLFPFVELRYQLLLGCLFLFALWTYLAVLAFLYDGQYDLPAPSPAPLGDRAVIFALSHLLEEMAANAVPVAAERRKARCDRRRASRASAPVLQERRAIATDRRGFALGDMAACSAFD